MAAGLPGGSWACQSAGNPWVQLTILPGRHCERCPMSTPSTKLLPPNASPTSFKAGGDPIKPKVEEAADGPVSHNTLGAPTPTGDTRSSADAQRIAAAIGGAPAKVSNVRRIEDKKLLAEAEEFDFVFVGGGPGGGTAAAD